MGKFEKITLSVGVFLVAGMIFLGAIVFRQQKTLNSLTGGPASGAKQVFSATVPFQGSSLEIALKNFSGTVESISGKQIVLKVELADFDKPKDPGKLKNAKEQLSLKSDDFEILEKKITVNINDLTIFEKTTLADLKIGDSVAIFSDKSPYESDVVAAEKVIYGGRVK